MKETILDTLRRGGYVSGQQLGRTAGVSRTAIWKYINRLRHEGYDIASSPNRGYLLLSSPDNPFPEEVRAGLTTRALGQNIDFHRQVISTQDVARTLALQGAEEGTVVIAEDQTSGRGRLGRQWASPPGGLYLSAILRPAIEPPEALKLPLIAGVAVAQAIEAVTPLKPGLKWPNDVLVNGRKVAGILTEMNAETDRVNYIIIGLGLNVNTAATGFPEEVRDIATSLFAESGRYVPRVRLVQSVFTRLEALYDEFRKSGFEPIRREWKRRTTVIGRLVTVASPNHEISGTAIDIDRDGALLLQTAGGRLERIMAGDVSLRKELPR